MFNLRQTRRVQLPEPILTELKDLLETDEGFRAYWEVHDAFPDLTFKTFITDPYFKETRERA